MYCHKLLGCTWRCLQGKCSTLLTDMFSPLNAGRATRSQGNRALKFPITKTFAGTHSASFQCVSLWNRLQPDIRKIPQYQRFMRSLPAHAAFQKCHCPLYYHFLYWPNWQVLILYYPLYSVSLPTLLSIITHSTQYHYPLYSVSLPTLLSIITHSTQYHYPLYSVSLPSLAFYTLFSFLVDIM